MSREKISGRTLLQAEKEIHDHVIKVLERHGWGSFASRHEVYGVLMEEVREFERTIEKGNLEEISYELKDIAQVCVFALACIREAGLEW